VDGQLTGSKIRKGVKMLDFKNFKHHYVLNMQERAVSLFLVNLTNLHLQILTFGVQVFGKRHLLCYQSFITN
jgi:hypothetical protein